MLRYMGNLPDVVPSIILGGKIGVGMTSGRFLAARDSRGVFNPHAVLDGNTVVRGGIVNPIVNGQATSIPYVMKAGDVITFGDKFQFIFDDVTEAPAAPELNSYPTSIVRHDSHLQIVTLCTANETLNRLLRLERRPNETPTAQRYPECEPSTDINCCICYETLVAPHSVPGCGHTFCGACIYSWVGKGRRNCPTCRNNSFSTPAYNKQLDEIINSEFVPGLSDDEKESRAERLAQWRIIHAGLIRRKRFSDISLVLTTQHRRNILMDLHSEACAHERNEGRVVGYSKQAAKCSECERRIRYGDVVCGNAHAQCMTWVPGEKPPLGLENIRAVDAQFCLFL